MDPEKSEGSPSTPVGQSAPLPETAVNCPTDSTSSALAPADHKTEADVDTNSSADPLPCPDKQEQTPLADKTVDLAVQQISASELSAESIGVSDGSHGAALSPTTTADSTTTAKSDSNTEVVDPTDDIKQNVAVSAESSAEADQVVSTQNEATLEPASDPQPKSEASSPVSPSTSGQDSGVGPDDSGSDSNAKSPSPTEAQPGLSEDQAKNQTVVAAPADANASPGSETPVTVSDLDTPGKEEDSATSSAVSSDPSTVAAAVAAASDSDQESVYYIKWIAFDQAKVPIITQNENGPCPLLAIMNVLLLKGKVKLAPMLEMITSEQLMTYLGECIFENMPQDLSETTRANYEQNMQDAMGVMYKLQTGLDVNVKFTGVGDFEYTSECIIFDLLELSLYHGWLVDPQDAETVKAVNQCSYNQLVEKIISLKHSEQEDNVTYALIAEQFLDRTASQLTYHGLCELSSHVKEKELCVFFRNNHFNTLYKHNNELFLLVTDQGFLTERNVVWETLSNVDGDCHFVDGSFRTYTKPAASTEPIPDPSVPVGSAEQIDHDYQVALFLQEEAAAQPQQPTWGGFQQENAAIAQADLEFAMQLQEEENRMALAEQQRAATGPAAQAPRHHQGQGRPVAAAGGPAPEAQQQQRRSGDRDRSERREKEGRDCCIL
ncbi:ubiquitin carboxyl-terminal hydrolase MINDY-1 [Aplysia californica]|uniref:Ubiquitin carboxyl-terminal hydrolase n=1 Tax=Aplysia californica TaxID=6500 RepID=A0ABM1W2D6_APLCA|nr:ubiquitin carboxyl-terminal hydrolase MINDY-1 [Aplysia californica]XP_035828829.1 ubiquitin carboxyl-terminal hydrolase MINDY-1 [Aplysia californica]